MFAICIVIASGGYPGKSQKGFKMQGITKAQKVPGVVVFHAGTQLVNNKLITSGGRVLGVTAVGRYQDIARNRAYEAVEKIHFEGMQYRKDIGVKASITLST